VHLEDGELIASGEGAVGGVWGDDRDAGCKCGDHRSGKVIGGGAWVHAVAVVRLGLGMAIAPTCWCEGGQAWAMRQQEIVTSWLPAWLVNSDVGSKSGSPASLIKHNKITSGYGW
jgi:hypothetical protein